MHEVFKNKTQGCCTPLKIVQIVTDVELVLRPKRLTTGKNQKEYSWYAPAIKFIGMKQLV